jgi:hypothetical protein
MIFKRAHLAECRLHRRFFDEVQSLAYLVFADVIRSKRVLPQQTLGFRHAEPNVWILHFMEDLLEVSQKLDGRGVFRLKATAPPLLAALVCSVFEFIAAAPVWAATIMSPRRFKCISRSAWGGWCIGESAGLAGEGRHKPATPSRRPEGLAQSLRIC